MANKSGTSKVVSIDERIREAAFDVTFDSFILLPMIFSSMEFLENDPAF